MPVSGTHVETHQADTGSVAVSLKSEQMPPLASQGSVPESLVAYAEQSMVQ